MKKKFTEEQIAFALKQAEHGIPLSEVVRKMGISEQTFYCWKTKDGQAALRMRIKAVAAVRVRYAYKRIHVLLQREGWGVTTSGSTGSIVKKG